MFAVASFVRLAAALAVIGTSMVVASTAAASRETVEAFIEGKPEAKNP